MQAIPSLKSVIGLFTQNRERILQRWVSYTVAKETLDRHAIDPDFFVERYATRVYNYFADVIAGEMRIGDCPAITELLAYFKDHDISAQELFLLCSHFRRAMVDISYEIGVNSQPIYDEISYVFDLNFAGVLKQYTETIRQKDLEIERNVKLLEEYRRAIDESAIVAKTDASGMITYANDKLCSVCGYTRRELVGRPHSIVRHTDMPTEFFAQLWQSISSGAVFRGTIKNRAKDGQAYYVDTTIVPIADTAGKTREYMAISYEVTDLVVAKEEAIAAGDAKEFFLSNMSHEIRTPLNAILGFVELLKDELASEKHRRYLDIVHHSGEHLFGIINDILDFSKLRSKNFTIEPRAFNLHSTLSHTLELFVANAAHHHLSVTSFIDPGIPYELIADPLRIQQVLSNLLSNAIKFTPAGGEIRLEAAYGDGQITISVSDTGVGIAKKDRGHIFDPFSQARSDCTQAIGGTGLGLSISAQLVGHMGGTIVLESEPGAGSTFVVTLPVTAGELSRTGMMEIDWIKPFRLALLCESEARDAMRESLVRYLEHFSITFTRVQSVSAEYDVLFYSQQTVSQATQKLLLADPRPKIVLTDIPCDDCDSHTNVTMLVMPLYCAKLQEAMRAALTGPQAGETPEEVSPLKLRGHVLVAEDNEANQELIGTLLANLGLTFEIVGNGAEALEKLESGCFDIVLMDEQMPVMGGSEALTALRQLEKREKRTPLPVLALTANVLGGEAHRDLYDDFLYKPIRTQTLVRSLRRFLEPPRDTNIAEELPSSSANVIDRSVLMTQLQVSKEQLELLLSVYRTTMGESIEKMAVAICAGDWQSVARTAHSMKGSSSNFRLAELTDLAEQIEKRARAGAKDFDYRTHFEQLQAAYACFEKQMDSV